MLYPVESFTPDERALLAPHVTNLDQPVFALVGLPETVKGALFARYSRYQGTLRRLFLDEFADSLGTTSTTPAWEGDEGRRAADLYERIFVGYGDDSIQTFSAKSLLRVSSASGAHAKARKSRKTRRGALASCTINPTAAGRI